MTRIWISWWTRGAPVRSAPAPRTMTFPPSRRTWRWLTPTTYRRTFPPSAVSIRAGSSSPTRAPTRLPARSADTGSPQPTTTVAAHRRMSRCRKTSRIACWSGCWGSYPLLPGYRDRFATLVPVDRVQNFFRLFSTFFSSLFIITCVNCEGLLFSMVDTMTPPVVHSFRFYIFLDFLLWTLTIPRCFSCYSVQQIIFFFVFWRKRCD